MRSSTEMLIKFMRIVSGNNDTIVALAIAEAADRLEEQQKRITQLETENDAMRADLLLWEQKEIK